MFTVDACMMGVFFFDSKKDAECGTSLTLKGRNMEAACPVDYAERSAESCGWPHTLQTNWIVLIQ